MWNIMKKIRYETRKGRETGRGGGEIRESKRAVNMMKVHYICALKNHNKTYYFIQLIYANNAVCGSAHL
jgi:hypothetical protein